ncbi:MAG TPA: lysine biosynthesis protein LysW [Anaerolineae bacterium]|nr:lysine biosynthesis protein LysW [Anaerolineae bacterium]
MPLATCPGCDGDIMIPYRAKIGDGVTCPSCGAELEVVDTDPIDLDWAYDDSDYEHDDGDDDDES